MAKDYFVRAEWDPKAEVWYVAESNVPGLATEAKNVDQLISKLKIMIPEMLELNGVIQGGVPAVPFSLLTQVDGGALTHH